jgi:hypothetical protein
MGLGLRNEEYLLCSTLDLVLRADVVRCPLKGGTKAVFTDFWLVSETIF